MCDVNTFSSVCLSSFHLSASYADDAVDAATGIVEEGHGDCVLAGRQPVALGSWINLEDMSSGAEDGLLPLKVKTDYRL